MKERRAIVLKRTAIIPNFQCEKKKEEEEEEEEEEEGDEVIKSHKSRK
jgi:hypothetical protein